MAPWERDESAILSKLEEDHKCCKGRGRLVVSLKQKPPAYVPNTGPPSQPITVIPPNDSTGYVIERILLPPNDVARDGKPRPKRMTYIVGWRDLPAARLLVPAMDILDYVSPRELENWETALEEELSRDRIEAEEQNNKDGQPTGGRRRRPPAHAQIESAAAAELETGEDGAKGRLTGGALSLSTPVKYRLKDFEGLSDDARSSSQQLYDSNGTPARASGVDAETGDFYDAEDDMELDGAAGSQAADLVGCQVDAPYAAESSASPRVFPVAYAGGTSWVSAGPSWTSVHSKQRHLYTPGAGSVDLSATDEPTRTVAKRRSSSRSHTPQVPRAKRKQAAPKPTCGANQATASPDEEEKEWVVDRIEDDTLYEVEGRGLVRYFQVRWEGDWPPDENPTWEPEDNLAPQMIRSYLRKKDAKAADRRRSKAGKQRRVRQSTLPVLEWRKYGSIAEDEDDSGTPSAPDAVVDQDGHAIDDDFLDVDGQGDISSRSRFMWKENRSALLGMLRSSNA